MTLTLDGVEKNGVLSRFNYLFPSQLMQEEMEKNGGSEASKAYKDYKKSITIYWIVSILGIVAIVGVGLGILPTAVAASATAWNSAFLLYMLVTIGVSIAVALLGKKSFRQLARSIWLYNRHVLLKK